MQLFERLRQWWQIHSGEEDTPLDGDTPAWVVSLLLHLSLLVILTLLTAIRPAADQTLTLSAEQLLLEDEIVPEELHFDDIPQPDIGVLSQGGEQSPEPDAMVLDDFSEIAAELEMPVETGDVAIVSLEMPISIAPETDQRALIKGVGTVGLAGAAGAIDRITHEILRSLDQRPTLVVWLFDQSGSLSGQRAMIHDRLDRIYDELGVIEASGNKAFSRHLSTPLLTSVMEFGIRVRFILEQPTDDLETIKAAVRSVQNDDSGHENVFQAIYRAADTFRRFRTLTKKNRRNVMLVVFTDEVGDDTNGLDPTVDICRRFGMPVYVVGVPAPFGRRSTRIKYVDPDPNFDQTPQWIPIDQGPESLLPERIKLRFARSTGRDEPIDSGFGPFCLTRLCYETGGIYFAIHPNHNNRGRVTPGETGNMASYLSRFFDPTVMRRYRPDYISVQEYHNLLASNHARAALVGAAKISWTMPMEEVRTVFPKQDEPQLARDVTIAQRMAAKLEPKLRQIYETLKVGEPDRPKLKKPRWRAGYDLAMGRVLAVKVRTEGYNGMLAKAKQGMKFENDRNDTWVLVPADDISVGSILEKQAAQGKTYLERVVKEHPNTPWAWLAERELQIPLGWRWTERYTGVNAPRPQVASNNNNNNRQPRDDQRRMLAPRKPRRPAPAL